MITNEGLVNGKFLLILTLLVVFCSAHRGGETADEVGNGNELELEAGQLIGKELMEQAIEKAISDDQNTPHLHSHQHQETENSVSKRFSRMFETPIVTMMNKQKSAERQRQVWRNLPDTYCSNNKCSSRRDCCRSSPICHPQAKICIQCQLRSACTDDADCCPDYPYCHNESRRRKAGECYAEPLYEEDGLYKRLYYI